MASDMHQAAREQADRLNPLHLPRRLRNAIQFVYIGAEDMVAVNRTGRKPTHCDRAAKSDSLWFSPVVDAVLEVDCPGLP